VSLRLAIEVWQPSDEVHWWSMGLKLTSNKLHSHVLSVIGDGRSYWAAVSWSGRERWFTCWFYSNLSSQVDSHTNKKVSAPSV